MNTLTSLKLKHQFTLYFILLLYNLITGQIALRPESLYATSLFMNPKNRILVHRQKKIHYNDVNYNSYAHAV